MPDPIVYVTAGPNGAGKSTLVGRAIMPVTRLPFVNADELARQRWPGSEAFHSDEARELADARRKDLIDARRSFITETVFSHPSRLELINYAREAGYLVHLHVVMIPETLAVARVADRVAVGGHEVSEDKIRARYRRLWAYVSEAVSMADEAVIYDNSRAATPFRKVAEFRDGKLVAQSGWPTWTPDALWPGRPGIPSAESG